MSDGNDRLAEVMETCDTLDKIYDEIEELNKIVRASKFYLRDIGVTNVVLPSGRELDLEDIPKKGGVDANTQQE